MRGLKSILLMTCLTLLAACGNKGPVQPLKTSMPRPITAPELRQQGDALLLGWQLPTSNLDDTPLKQPPMVEIYRMTYDPADECPECFDRSTLLTSINPELPAPALRVGNRYLLHDRPLQAEIGYQYKLIVLNEDGRQSRPIILRQTYSEPIGAPQHLKLVPQDRSVSLQWQAPPLKTNDSLIGYLVYRRQNADGSPYPLTSQPLKDTKFEDFSLDNGTRYHYQVRALVKRGNNQLEGLASPELSATPQAGI